MDSGTGFAGIIDLFLTIIKFLGRSAVQLQLLAIILALILAWYLSKPIITRMGRLYGRWLAGRRETVLAAGGQSVTDDAGARKSLQRFRPFIQVADVIVFPLMAILLIMLSIIIFRSLGWFAGLLSDALSLLVLFLLYRLLIGISYVLFDKQQMIQFQVRFFQPFFAVIIILLIIGGITDLSALAQAPLFPLFDGLLTLGTLFLVTVGLYLWIMATKVIVHILQAVTLSRTKTDPRALEAWLILTRYLLIAGAIIVAFQLIGFSQTTLAAVLGGLSIGIGFALEDVLKNFLGGIILLFEGSVRPGDWIQVDDTIGKVESLRIRSTVVRTGNNLESIVPNQDYLSSTIVAYSNKRSGFWLRIPVKVSSENNVREVQDLLVAVAKQFPGTHPEPPPGAALVGFDRNSLHFVLNAWILDIQTKGRSEAELRVLIFEALLEQGIELAGPLPE